MHPVDPGECVLGRPTAGGCHGAGGHRPIDGRRAPVATSKAELASALTWSMRQLRPDAALWVSWPKKASKVSTDITEDTIRALGFPLGLVDIKVCAVDDTWSGLKLVLRKAHRPGQANKRPRKR